MPSDIEAKRIHDNPSPEELRAFTEEMPQTKISGFDNVNVQTRATSRSSASTFVVGEEGSSSGKVISRETTTGNRTTIYDPAGRNVGRVTTSPQR